MSLECPVPIPKQDADRTRRTVGDNQIRFSISIDVTQRNRIGIRFRDKRRLSLKRPIAVPKKYADVTVIVRDDHIGLVVGVDIAHQNRIQIGLSGKKTGLATSKCPVSIT